MVNNNENGGKRVKAVQTTFRILETIQELDGARVTDIAQHTGMTKSTVYRHLQTLEADEYLVRDDDQYRLGMQFLNFGDYIRRRNKAHSMAHEKVKELAEVTEERAQYMVEEHGSVFYVHRETGNHGIRLRRRLGERVPVHRSSAGKAILAEYSNDHIHEICDKCGLEAKTETSITSREELFENIEEVRERGYAFNQGENSEGVRAVGVSVNGPHGVIGALSVAGPAHRLKGDLLTEELPDLLLGTANELELNIKHA